MAVGLSQFRLASPPKGGEFESHYRLSLMVFATRGVTIPCQGYDPSSKKKKKTRIGASATTTELDYTLFSCTSRDKFFSWINVSIKPVNFFIEQSVAANIIHV